MIEGTDTAQPVSAPGPATDGPIDAHAAPEGAAAERMRQPAFVPDPGHTGSAGRQGGDDGRQAGHYDSRHGRSGRRERGPFYAALDLGTNNCRLLVAEPSPDGFRVVDSFSRIVRLGEGVAQSGNLKPEAMDRALGALRVCSQKLDDRPLARARLIATEACRRAGNGAHFLARVRNETGLDLEIIDRRTEARLAVEGCFSLLDEAADGALVFDIGGGSSEIIWLDRRKMRRRNGLMRAWASLPMGVVTLAERHGGVDVDSIIFEAMVDDVRNEFHRFQAGDALKNAIRDRSFHFLGTSGFDATERRTYEGRSLAVLRPTGPGKIHLIASAPECTPVEVLVTVESPPGYVFAAPTPFGRVRCSTPTTWACSSAWTSARAPITATGSPRPARRSSTSSCPTASRNCGPSSTSWPRSSAPSW